VKTLLEPAMDHGLLKNLEVRIRCNSVSDYVVSTTSTGDKTPPSRQEHGLVDTADSPL
jgi:hypothetical protein